MTKDLIENVNREGNEKIRKKIINNMVTFFFTSMNQEELEGAIFEAFACLNEECAWKLIQEWIENHGYLNEAYSWVREDHPDHT